MSFMSVLLWILGGLLALLVLLLVLPVGVQVCYDASGFTLRLGGRTRSLATAAFPLRLAVEKAAEKAGGAASASSCTCAQGRA